MGALNSVAADHACRSGSARSATTTRVALQDSRVVQGFLLHERLLESFLKVVQALDHPNRMVKCEAATEVSHTKAQWFLLPVVTADVANAVGCMCIQNSE